MFLKTQILPCNPSSEIITGCLQKTTAGGGYKTNHPAQGETAVVTGLITGISYAEA